MIALPTGARILPVTTPVDFRKGAHNLAALAGVPLS
jgi:transposase